MRPTIGKIVVIAGFASDALTRAGAAPLITGNRVHLLTSWLNNRKLDVNFGLSERRADSVLRELAAAVPGTPVRFTTVGRVVFEHQQDLVLVGLAAFVITVFVYLLTGHGL